jgi:CelD/BcsL family acetyltransferase involved in cellulose biosynthesis
LANVSLVVSEMNSTTMNYSITEVSLDWLNNYWQEERNKITWEPLFLLPPWIRVWLQVFSPPGKTINLVVNFEGKVIGIAPLILKDNVASLVGSPNICDYFDFLTVPGNEGDFYKALLGYLKDRRVKILDTGVVRPDSTVMSSLLPVAKEAGFSITTIPDELSLETDLPPTWDAYLNALEGKQRHEIKRKIRRLNENGEVSLQYITDKKSVPKFADIFLKMFVDSRQDKAAFLTRQMDAFFRNILECAAEYGFLRALILELDSRPVAALTAFDYHDTVYLYNSGYDPQYSRLSVGIVSKALLIKDTIAHGKKRFDFLKGGEQYKYYLGGKEIQLQKCRISIE